MTEHNCNDHHLRHYDIHHDNGDIEAITIFPTKPEWWDSDDAEDYRQHVFQTFKPTDLLYLIDEVAMYIDTPPVTAEEVAELMQRYHALLWFADICVDSLHYVPEDNQLDYYVRYWQQRAARYLAMAARQVVMSLPVPITTTGAAMAITKDE